MIKQPIVAGAIALTTAVQADWDTPCGRYYEDPDRVFKPARKCSTTVVDSKKGVWQRTEWTVKRNKIVGRSYEAVSKPLRQGRRLKNRAYLPS